MFKKIHLFAKVATVLKKVAAFLRIMSDTATYFIKEMEKEFPTLIQTNEKGESKDN